MVENQQNKGLPKGCYFSLLVLVAIVGGIIWLGLRWTEHRDNRWQDPNAYKVVSDGKVYRIQWPDGAVGNDIYITAEAARQEIPRIIEFRRASRNREEAIKQGQWQPVEKK